MCMVLVSERFKMFSWPDFFVPRWEVVLLKRSRHRTYHYYLRSGAISFHSIVVKVITLKPEKKVNERKMTTVT